ncbi:spore germination protein [Brevibacillus sp. FSL K6-0770]|uniref:spore germination protein n=1 Tax=unclassified Brevibacillus TaxID=2684853 RepID=UPI00156B957D|nr:MULTISPECIES: spore germination protein [unclassified Brevibacillus]MDH6350731.1 spore germination protein KA [Brevibacillus sp. 1238]NRQ53988.1 spore germination protein [Brevibacillus sp. HD1.4A]
MAQIGPRLDENVHFVKESLGYSNDIVIRELVLDSREPVRAAILYTDGMVDSHMVQGVLINSMLYKTRFKEIELEREEDLVPFLKDAVLTVGDIGDVNNFPELFTAMLSGCVIILIDGYEKAMAIGLQEWKDRGVTEPTAQTVIRGPREGFTESLRTNITLLRRRIASEKMWVETRRIGEVTKTEIAVVYIKGLVEEGVIEEVRNRLDRIDVDGLMESGMIEELIQDAAYTPFPTISNSERPDVVAANLLEGRVAIIVDGTPFVLTVPSLFVEFFHSAEDYYQRADFSTLIRMLRFVSFFIALLAPSLYIAITTFHQEMLPTQLLISLAAQREGVPFPALVEALLMEIAFEILREAGIRMPRAVGQAISVVGTLVIGQAAVEAGIVSAAMVIVVSITAISSFIFPAINMSIPVRILRFPLMILAASFGIYGIIVGVLGLVLHLCSLRSFGVPYMSTFAPFSFKEQRDAILRAPRWMMDKRPESITKRNMRRQSPNLKPKPPEH